MPLIVGRTVAESIDRVSSDSSRKPRRFLLRAALRGFGAKTLVKRANNELDLCDFEDMRTLLVQILAALEGLYLYRFE
jgi:hypothetical protein